MSKILTNALLYFSWLARRINSAGAGQGRKPWARSCYSGVKRDRAETPTSPQGPAEILFFTGVRYERHDDDRRAEAARSGGRRAAPPAPQEARLISCKGRRQVAGFSTEHWKPSRVAAAAS